MAEKIGEIFQSIFRVGVCALHTLGRHVVKHGLKKMKGKFAIAEREKNEVRDFYLLSSYPLVGRHVVNEPKVGCHCCNELEIS